MNPTRDEIRESRKAGVRLRLIPGARPKVCQAGTLPADGTKVVLVEGSRTRSEAERVLALGTRWESMSAKDRRDLLANDATEYGALAQAASRVKVIRE